MQEEKENFKEFMKTIKKKVRDWKSRHFWITRFFEYILLLGLVTFVIALIFSCFHLIHTEPTSARYMLSALVQSQAAIVAIVVSLTLIAVQHTASAYSPRVIRIFRDNPDMWILLLFYGFSIFYGLLVLKMIRGAEDTSQIMISSISLEAYISCVYALGISTFAILCLYIWNIMGLLTSETIINRLKIDITKANLLNPKEDPIQPIMDIIHGSIMKYDLETTRVGLKAVTEQVIEIIDSNDEVTISGRFCGHLMRVSRLTASREDEESAIEVVKNLENFGKSAAERDFENAVEQAVMSLRGIGITATEKGLVNVASEAANRLKEIGITAAEKGLGNVAIQVTWSLGIVGKTAAEKGLEGAAYTAAWSLGELGRTGLKNLATVAVSNLVMVGETAAEKGLGSVTMQVAGSLGIVGKIAAEKGLEDATRQAAKSLCVVGEAAVRNGLQNAPLQAAEPLAELTTSSEALIKTAVQDYESGLKEKDRDSFQKFMKIYEQKLEELRAEK